MPQESPHCGRRSLPPSRFHTHRHTKPWVHRLSFSPPWKVAMVVACSSHVASPPKRIPIQLPWCSERSPSSSAKDPTTAVSCGKNGHYLTTSLVSRVPDKFHSANKMNWAMCEILVVEEIMGSNIDSWQNNNKILDGNFSAKLIV
jgi:hypothetical protein